MLLKDCLKNRLYIYMFCVFLLLNRERVFSYFVVDEAMQHPVVTYIIHSVFPLIKKGGFY